MYVFIHSLVYLHTSWHHTAFLFQPWVCFFYLKFNCLKRSSVNNTASLRAALFQGFILNNYASNDMGAFLARIAVFGSIACGSVFTLLLSLYRVMFIRDVIVVEFSSDLIPVLMLDSIIFGFA